MTTATLHRPPLLPWRSAVVGAALVGSAVAAVLAVALVLSAAGLGSSPALPAAPLTPAAEPGVLPPSPSPMIVAGKPVDSVVGGASPIGSTAPVIDHAAAVGERSDSWSSSPLPGTAAAVAPAPVPVAPAADGEVGLIPAAVGWRDANGEVHQGLIGVDDIPAEVLGLPDGVTLDD